MKQLLTLVALLTSFLGAKAEYQVSLQLVPFWNNEGIYGMDAPKNTQTTPVWVVGESTGMPYGDSSVRCWADLSEYNKLVITYTEGEPRVMMNRDVAEGQYSATEEESHLIEYPKCASDWAGKYFSVVEDEGTGIKVLTIDLTQIVSDKGFAHLHAIKGANWQDVTIESMMLLSDEDPIDWFLPNELIDNWTSANHEHSSTSRMVWHLKSEESSMFRFDWAVSSESGCDRLLITLDGVQLVEASGEQSGSYENFLDAGQHMLIATYSKDGSTNDGSDQATVSNIQFGTLEGIIEATIAHVQNIAAANSHVNAVLLEESNNYIAQIQAGQYDKTKGNAIIAQLNEYATRLAYTHLDINVAVQGSMGDSILAYVNNFADVQSLRLSGKLDETDLNSLKNRLTNVKELYLAGLDCTTIPSEQFSGKTGLTIVELPANLQVIDYRAFYNCQQLRLKTFPTTLQSIGEDAFCYTYRIGDVVLPEGLSSMGKYAFYESGLTSVTFPSTLKTINYQTFYGCSNLKEVNFNGQTTLEAQAFRGCSGLESITFPETMITTDYEAFWYCTSLRNVELNENLEHLGSGIFSQCKALREITIPSTVLDINDGPFRYCDNLQTVKCLAIVPPYLVSSPTWNGSRPTFYVPRLSLNVYKQSTYYDNYDIQPIDVMPDNIVITSDYKLNWPDSLSIDYKPNVSVTTTDYSKYGSLTVTGNSTLSAGSFFMFWDEAATYDNTIWDSERQRYYYNRNRFASLVNNATVRADNVSIYLSLKANRWAFLSFPYDVKVSEIGINWEGTPFVIRKYDGQKRAEGLNSETWVNMTKDSTLHAGQGYIWQSASTDGNRNYTGFNLHALQTVNKNNIFANGDLEVPLAYYESEFAHNRSWNLIGNPYPCFYDIRAMQTSAPITIWNNYDQNYEAFSPMDDAYILNPSQAFFVQRPVNEEKITFLQEGRQINTTVRDVEYGNNRAASVAERNVFNVTLTGNDKSDRTRFVINSNAQMDYEAGRDASKFMSLETQSIQLYTMLGDVRYAINERPLADGLIELGIQVCAEGTYTITLDTKAENEVYLIDRTTGTETRIDGTEGYSFYAEKGIVEGRFAIRMGNGVVTGINAIDNSQLTNDSYYNLKGQRIASPTKGLYIKNGKKMIVK